MHIYDAVQLSFFSFALAPFTHRYFGHSTLLHYLPVQVDCRLCFKVENFEHLEKNPTVYRGDIHELFNEILYNDNLDLYKHWLVVEQQESDESQPSSQLSSPNGFSLTSEEGRNGTLLQYK